MNRSIEKSIHVHVPVHTAYNQWTQFEEFPQFMEGVREIKQLDDHHVHWRAEVGGKEKEWDAEISEQTPDQRISWHSIDGVHNAGTVEFSPLGPEETEVRVRMEYEPEGIIENIGAFFNTADARVEGDLERFKKFIETRGEETGAWRGEIHERARMPGLEQPGSRAPSMAAGAMGTGAIPSAGITSATGRSTRHDEVLPEAREKLQVGKRRVQRGGVRVRSRMQAEDAREQVRLREEHAQSIDELSPEADRYFRAEHRRRFGDGDDRYEDYMPAYGFGSSLRSSYSGREWSDIEPQAHQQWEGRSPGTWERFKEAIRLGWAGPTQRRH